MEKSERPPFVVLLSGKDISCREAERMVRRRMSREGEKPWRFMELEIYSGAGGSLVIARPRTEERMYISSFALQYLSGKK